jgi:Holliday junction resolvase
MRNAKVDKNQPEIVKALRRSGAIVKHVHTVKNLFDILVYYNGQTFNVEIKTDKKKKLTKGEQECKTDLESVGVKYHIIYSIEDALKMIGIK